jgi:hypothetical protein
MEPAEFLRVARSLAESNAEAEWRTSIGRSYFAVFNQVRRRIAPIKTLPTTDEVHALVVGYLQNANNQDLRLVGQALHDLRISRNEADYDLDVDVDQTRSRFAVAKATKAMQRFTDLNQTLFVAAIQSQPTRRREPRR